MAGLNLRNVVKRFGRHDVINGVDLEIAAGEFCVLVGPSGCGKSTLLRMIAGLEEITRGELEIGGRRVNEVPPSGRGVSMVFQNYALYPHMTVFRNIAFGLKLARTEAKTIEDRVAEVARILQLEDLLDRKPRELSGGQRQRVAIGRAIVRDPEVFLFDEPLSNLDAALRVQMRLEIGRLHRRLGTTMIYVTHDQIEAMTLADKIVVLNEGRIEQVGTPRELYDRPSNLFVAGFIGSPAMNLMKARIHDGMAVIDGARDNAGIPFEAQSLPEGMPVTVGVRPENWQIAGMSDRVEARTVPFEIEVVEDLGDMRVLHGVLAGGPVVTLREPSDHAVRRRGESLAIMPARGAAHLFDPDGMRVPQGEIPAGDAMRGRRLT